MIRMTIRIIALIAGLNISYGQQKSLPDELYGFRLGQYKGVVSHELGEPVSTQVMEDSTSVDFYYVSKDSSTYVAFQYLRSQGNPIYMIQLSGKRADRSFYGIQLGDDEQKCTTVFGKPDTVLSQSFNDKASVIWKYNSKNLSILFAEKRTASIRIWDNFEQKDFSHPTMKDLLTIIGTNDKAKIANILSPGLEVYRGGEVITWQNSFYTDMRQSRVMDLIINRSYGLASLVGKKEMNVEAELRMAPGVGSFPVFKLPSSSPIEEVVLKYEQGRYKIYEVKYRK